VTIITLIIAYMLLVFANIVLDGGCNNSDSIKDALFALKIVELVILSLFTIEILSKCFVFGFKSYFSDCWNLVDAIIILLTFALVIVDIEIEDSSIEGLSRIRAVFRLFRIFVLMRKANEVSRISRNSSFKTKGIDVRAPVEKILGMLDHIKATTKDKEFKNEVQWAITMIASN